MLKFQEMPDTVLEHFKGGEGSTITKMFADDLNRIFISRLQPGCSIGLHTHDTSSEVIYVLEGVGTTILDGVTEILQPGDCSYCKKGGTHTLMNKGEADLVFFAVVPQQ
jgi:quercetin dioxygenase-like cupin family protein